MNIPNDVVDFSFNLNEDANKSLTLELIGASSLIQQIMTGHAMKCLLPETNHLLGMMIMTRCPDFVYKNDKRLY